MRDSDRPAQSDRRDRAFSRHTGNRGATPQKGDGPDHPDCRFRGASISVLVFLLYGMVRGGWLDALLAGIAICMSLLPEEFPVVLTIFLATGAWRIAQVGVPTRRALAIEAMGATTVLCTDKTGTLTQNRMVAAALWLSRFA